MEAKDRSICLVYVLYELAYPRQVQFAEPCPPQPVLAFLLAENPRTDESVDQKSHFAAIDIVCQLANVPHLTQHIPQGLEIHLFWVSPGCLLQLNVALVSL